MIYSDGLQRFSRNGVRYAYDPVTKTEEKLQRVFREGYWWLLTSKEIESLKAWDAQKEKENEQLYTGAVDS